jgi:Spy/CpxP family protein refolding chaperone
MAAKTKIAGLMVAVMALSMPLVYADNGSTTFTTGGGGDKDSWHQGEGWHHGQKDHMMAKILNLSGDQVKQLKDLRQKQKETMKSTFEQIKSNREAFNAEIVKAAPDMNKINDLQNQLKTIQGKMIDNRLNSVLAIKKIMTPEQFAGFAALQQERKLMRHMMMGHDKFGHKDGFGKDRDGQKNWGDQGKDGNEGPNSDD